MSRKRPKYAGNLYRRPRLEFLDPRLPLAGDMDDALSEAISLGTASTIPRTLSGIIDVDTDVDMHRISVSAGQTVDFDIDTSLNGPGGLGSVIRLFNSQGQQIASNNNGLAPGESVVGFDSYLRFTFNTGGSYYLSVSNATNTTFNPITGDGDIAGGPHATGTYQVTAVALPVDNDDSLTEARNLGSIATAGDTVNDNIVTDIDVDLYRFTVTNGQVVDFDIDTAINGPGGVGTFIRLFNSTGQEIAFNDNGTAPGEGTLGFDSYLRHAFTTGGTYYLGVSSANNTLYNTTTGGNDAAGGPNSIGEYQINIQTAAANPVDTDDTISEAFSLGPVATTPDTVNGSISPDVDVDMYQFTATAGQIVDIDLDTALNGPGGLGTFVRLFNAQGQEIAFNDNAIAPGENTVGFDSYLRFTIPTTGTYYIGVSNAHNTLYNTTTGAGDVSGGANATGDYQLIVQALPVDDDDALTEATPLGSISGTADVVNDSIASDIDVDLYQFTVTAGQSVDFDLDTPLNGPGGLGTFLRLFNAQGQEIAFNDNGLAPGENTLGFDSFLRYTFTTGGTYYVGVSNANNTLYNTTTGGQDAAGGPNSIGTYQLTIRSTAVDPNDTDDTLTEAISLDPISTTPETTSGTITNDIDVDVYRFTATAGQVIDFDIDTALNGPGGLGSYLRIFNSQGQELASNNDATAPGESVLGFDSYLRFTFTTSGTYYVSVSNANNRLFDPLTGNNDVPGGENATGDYQLVVRAQPVDTDDSLTEARNVGAAPATAVTFTDTIEVDTDVDLYRFTVTNGQIVDFDVDTLINGPGGVGTFIRLFNSSGQEIAFNDNGTAPGESTLGFDSYLRHAFAAGGTYYLGVSNANNTLYNTLDGSGDVAGGANAMGAYQLVMQVTGSTATDPDDTLSEANLLGPLSASPAAVNGSIAPDTDVNMYRFTVAANQTIDFDIDTPTNGGSGLGSYIRIFNASGQQIAFNDNGASVGENLGLDSYLRFTFTSEGTYYVGVSNSTNVSYNASTGNGDISGGANSTGSYQLIATIVPGSSVPALSLSTNLSAISEQNGTAIGTITRSNSDLSVAMVVTLASSDTSEATVPTTVTIPANQASATFTITAVDDSIIDGAQAVTITASATGFDGSIASIQVNDNDSTWTNPETPTDVNDDGNTTAFDALAIINYLNQFGAGPVPGGSPPPYLDVNSDNVISAFDALVVINFLNSNPIGSGGEAITAAEASSVPSEGAFVEAESAAEADTTVESHDAYFAELGAELASRQQAAIRPIVPLAFSSSDVQSD